MTQYGKHFNKMKMVKDPQVLKIISRKQLQMKNTSYTSI